MQSVSLIGAVVVQVEPVRQLNLEAYPHQVPAVLRWQVYDEPTGGVRKQVKMGRYDFVINAIITRGIFVIATGTATTKTFLAAFNTYLATNHLVQL